MTRDRLYSVQYLRGFAVIIVAYIHGVKLQMGSGTESYQQKFNFMIGAFSVDMFFIISGFIMCYVFGKYSGIKDFIKYLKKKFIRINVVYYFTSLVMILCLFIFSPGEISLENIIKTLTIIPIFDSGDEFTYPLIYVGWTLSYEWFFYILYAVFIILSIVKRREIYLIYIFFALFIIGFFFPIREIHYIFVTNPMFLEFGIGMAIAVIYRNVKKVHISIPVILGVVTLFIFIYLINNGIGKTGEAYLINKGIYAWHRVFTLGIPAALLFGTLLFLEKRTTFNFYKSDKLAFLGDASYSIFLTHPILYFLISRIPHSILLLVNPDLLIILNLLIVIGFGILYYKFIEKKLISIFNNLLLRRN